MVKGWDSKWWGGRNTTRELEDKIKNLDKNWVKYIETTTEHPVLESGYFYFVHSYYIEAGKPQQVVGRGHYGKDFAAALKKLKFDLEPEQLDRIVECFDLNGDGTIDYEEFAYTLKKATAPPKNGARRTARPRICRPRRR